MKNGLAIWHYPHRSVLENVSYFAECGFDSVSILGQHMDKVCQNSELSKRLADIIKEKNIILTVHHKLPLNHSDESVLDFKSSIDRIAKWQNRYGLLSILSFDVAEAIRDNVAGYIQYVLDKVPASKIAVEDFGLNEKERVQIEHLKTNKRFGYLIDIGHMYIRICGKNDEKITLFTNSPDEGSVNDNPGFEEFLKAFRLKDFPIFEIHLHNNDGKDDLHYFLEDGTLKINIIADVLKEIGYDGVLTIESAPGYRFECKYPESDKRISATYSLWKRLID